MLMEGWLAKRYLAEDTVLWCVSQTLVNFQRPDHIHASACSRYRMKALKCETLSTLLSWQVKPLYMLRVCQAFGGN